MARTPRETVEEFFERMGDPDERETVGELFADDAVVTVPGARFEGPDAAASFLAFLERLLAFRRKHPIFRRRSFLTGNRRENGCKDVSWWHPSGREMGGHDWQERGRTTLGMLLCGAGRREADPDGRVRDDASVLVVFHGRRPQAFTLPAPLEAPRWRLAFRTDDPEAEGDLFEPGREVAPVVDAVMAFEAVGGGDEAPR